MHPTAHFLSHTLTPAPCCFSHQEVGDNGSDLGSTKLKLRTYHLPHLSNVFQNLVRTARTMTSSLSRKWKEFRGPGLNMK